MHIGGPPYPVWNFVLLLGRCVRITSRSICPYYFSVDVSVLLLGRFVRITSRSMCPYYFSVDVSVLLLGRCVRITSRSMCPYYFSVDVSVLLLGRCVRVTSRSMCPYYFSVDVSVLILGRCVRITSRSTPRPRFFECFSKNKCHRVSFLLSSIRPSLLYNLILVYDIYVYIIVYQVLGSKSKTYMFEIWGLFAPQAFITANRWLS